MSKLRVFVSSVQYDVSRLRGLGLVEKRGSARATYYVLKERRRDQ
jgi:hypothetical protein